MGITVEIVCGPKFDIVHEESISNWEYHRFDRFDIVQFADSTFQKESSLPIFLNSIYFFRFHKKPLVSHSHAKQYFRTSSGVFSAVDGPLVSAFPRRPEQCFGWTVLRRSPGTGRDEG